jgi:hypothetical protein
MMSQNLTIEIPKSDAKRFEAVLDDLLQLLTRMEAERPVHEAEDAKHNQQFRERMNNIWAIIENVEQAH